MNGIEKIIAHLEADTQAEIDAHAAETKARCDEILAEAQAQADAVYAERIKVGQKEAALQEERLCSAAEMEAKKSILNFKQNTIGDTFLAAERAIAALPKAEYTAFLARLAAGAAETCEEELIFSERDASAVGKAVTKAANALLKEQGKLGGLSLSEETRKISGGVVLRQGNIETNCSLSALIDAQRSALASPVAEMLFGD